MQLRFLGTGTSMGVPVIGCDCPICTSSDPRHHRLRTSALIRSHGLTILIDAGPDFRIQALNAGLRRIDAVLLTHAHFDHVAGLDDLRPFCLRQGSLPIFGSARTLADVRQRFAYAFDDSSQGSSRPSITLHAVEEPFQIGPLTIVPIAVPHGTWMITAYRIGALGYVTDASTVPPSAIMALRGVRVLVLNALRAEPHPTHLSIAEAGRVAQEVGAQRTFLVHMTHSVDYRADYGLPPEVTFAYDGLEIEV
ncbi:MAG: MBL fold metallo-hydrolase [Pirellulaceae bacterium]|nr:MAG: MBL fold metallo-hydrolase [Pirellulaceae bacterium]